MSTSYCIGISLVNVNERWVSLNHGRNKLPDLGVPCLALIRLLRAAISGFLSDGGEPIRATHLHKYVGSHGRLLVRIGKVAVARRPLQAMVCSECFVVDPPLRHWSAGRRRPPHIHDIFSFESDGSMSPSRGPEERQSHAAAGQHNRGSHFTGLMQREIGETEHRAPHGFW